MDKQKETIKKKKKEKNGITFDKQKVTIAVLILIILLSVASTIFFIVKNGQAKDDTNSVLIDTTVSNLSINNSFITSNSDGSTSFNATVTNTLNSDYQISELIATLTVGGEKIDILILKNTVIKSNESRQVTVTVDKDLSNLTAINYVVK